MAALKMAATRKAAKKTAVKPRGRAAQGSEFTQSLVLNQWLFGLFGLDSTDGYYPMEGGRRVPLLEAFKQRFQLNEHSEEGLDENNVHRFHHAMVNQITGELPGVTRDELLAFDQNIVRHTLVLNAERSLRRERPVVWKYYQYLALLFVEIYLDRYFRDPQVLAQALNAHIGKFNAGKEAGQQLPPLDEGRDAALGLNKLALWCATGSGKTLLMHLNLRQYQHHLAQAGRGRELNRIVLLTPNEGLSHQHLQEFAAAGIEAELFDKSARSLFAGKAVEIIDIHKLADDMGDKTVAVDAFETGNLVLVDEGHRGASGGEAGKWLSRRDQLCEKGFSFEYSATFKQAVRDSVPLSRRYARSIVFDYSYRYFYGDGYGKDYQILNLDDATEQQGLDVYLTACLLAAYQQRRLFDDRQAQLRDFNLERPLWIFVGGSVNAVRRQGGRDVSDVTEVLLFLSRFTSERTRAERTITVLLGEGLPTASGQNPFANRFGYLNELGLPVATLFADICTRLFNAPGGGALHVEYLKGADGELALKLGNNDPFGVINVGDAKKLYDLCNTTPGLVAEERDFAGSLFRRINDRDNAISLLIGSRKFTEGWNSWRVSTLGLMKIGQSEGAQIIQLFGRGVRLKGYGWCLKRSSKIQRLPAGVERPRHIELLETLNVFGVHADYMAQFRQFLEDEGLPSDQDSEEIVLPVLRNLGTHKLKIIRLKPEIHGVRTAFGVAFRQLAPVPQLAPPQGEADHWLLRNRVQLNWYPKIQAMKAAGLAGGDGVAELERGKLGPKHVALLDLDRAWFELIRFKNERGWHNFDIPRPSVDRLLADTDWYDLLIPESMLAMDSFAKVAIWQEIAETLLKKYAERYYSFRKKGWEEPHLEYAELDAGDPNFPEAGAGVGEEQGVYRVSVEKSEEALITQLRQLGDELRRRAGVADKAYSGGQAKLEVMSFKGHLYEPLIKASGANITVRPVSLNDGEMRFVRRLKDYCAAHPEEFEDRPLFLLRNMSRGRGIGFFEAGNFHPDFIVWRIDGSKQRISFVDPKGIRQLDTIDDPKIQFHRTIQEIEARMADPDVSLRSYIVSGTSAVEMEMHWKVTRQKMAERNILFDEDEGYVARLIRESAPEA